MSQTLDDHGVVFTGLDEPGFALATNAGVTVRPLLVTEAGHRVDAFYLTIAAGAEINAERHPYSETLVMVHGEFSCALEGDDPVVVRPGQICHIHGNAQHHVRNDGPAPAEAVMLIGV